MRRKIAEAHNPCMICPLCTYLTREDKDLVEHLIQKHEDKEAYWNDGGKK